VVYQYRAMPIVLRGELYNLIGLVRAAVFASGQWQKVGGNSGGNSVPLKQEVLYYSVAYVATSIPLLATIRSNIYNLACKAHCHLSSLLFH
jgi:hypothetical protein